MTPQQPQSVKVVDFDMSITNLIVLFIKMAIASIPAFIIIWTISFIMAAIGMAVLGIGGAAMAG